MFRYFTSVFLLIVSLSGLSQTQNDTLFNYYSKTPVFIDGQATEECWENAEWHPIDQVWIPWAEKMKDGDFSGRFKVSWDEVYLYVLVEVVDDSLSDDHSNPLQNWWDDDCLEIFVDENRSKGDHERNCNAFAYHVSLFYDAVDLNSFGQGINYKDNILVDMDTIGNHTYLWEFAIKNFDATFNINNPDESRVLLYHYKKMGFAIAYCDNDEKTTRENFIGSMQMTQATANDMYKNADHFGLMILVNPDSTLTKTESLENQWKVNIYPVPARDFITVETSQIIQLPAKVLITDITGRILKTADFTGNRCVLETKEFKNGMYIIKVISGKQSVSKLLTIQ